MTLESQAATASHAGIVRLAWPVMLANITVPLLGLVDTTVVGNLGDAALIGAIALGAMIFGFVYWGFGFLRMSTTGIVAQAEGAGDHLGITLGFLRAALLAVVLSLVVLLLKPLIISQSLLLVDGSLEVKQAARLYLEIRIWSAPATLLNFVVLGLLLGLGRMRATLFLQVFMNGLNIALDFWFVFGLGLGIEGVAVATVLAEYAALCLGLFLVIPTFRVPVWTLDFRSIVSPDALGTLIVNSDLMLRTLGLLMIFAWFTNQSAKAGDTILAGNSILLQFITFSAYVLDGFALAAERLVGRAVGAKNEDLFRRAVTNSSQLSAATAVIMSLLVWALHPVVVDLITNVEEVRLAARQYAIWAVVIPAVSFVCFQLDGIFIGATRGREMRNSMLLTLVLFLAIWWFSKPLGNHGLWFALFCSYLVRALTLYVQRQRLLMLFK